MAEELDHKSPLPLILIRGFGGLSVADEKRIAYQGFNDGTVYHQKRGENYIYEGMILRLLKSGWEYQDATNVVGYYSEAVGGSVDLPPQLSKLPEGLFQGDPIVVDPPMADHLLASVGHVYRTVWVFRYYDLDNRYFPDYGKALVRLIDLIRELAAVKTETRPKVNIIAHSMGGLIVREAIQSTYPGKGAKAADYINKIVTLGTPHKGISFQVLRNWVMFDASDELERFNPKYQSSGKEPRSAVNFHKHFPLERLLSVVGTNYRTYGVRVSSFANRLFSAGDEYGPTYNRSDGLVKQANAQIDGAPRTFVHKCHGGEDSLVTSREAFEIATRFFFGDLRARLRLAQAEVLRGKDLFGKSEYFFGVSIKPRGVDFDLFHQSAEAENCYGPFHDKKLTDPDPAFGWAGKDRLIWEGWFDTSRILDDRSRAKNEIAMRLDFYVGERDVYGVGFSDNVIFRKQYYVRAVLGGGGKLAELFRHTSEDFVRPKFKVPAADRMRPVNGGWEFDVGGTGFKATLRVEVEPV